jgi:hypothetical protein
MDRNMQDIVKSAMPDDRYQQLMRYLTARNAVPQMQAMALPGIYGSFQRLQNAPEGVLRIDHNRGFTPDLVNTLNHELTHAAENQMINQYYDQEARFGLVGKLKSFFTGKETVRTPAERRFADAYEKLLKGDQTQALTGRISKEWAGDKSTDYNAYRTTGHETRAFGVGNSDGRRVYQDTRSAESAAAPHVDATVANEFMILLDSALKALPQVPATTKNKP